LLARKGLFGGTPFVFFGKFLTNPHSHLLCFEIIFLLSFCPNLIGKRKQRRKRNYENLIEQLLATDILVLATMKNAAKFDNLMRIAEFSESSNL